MNNKLLFFITGLFALNSFFPCQAGLQDDINNLVTEKLSIITPEGIKLIPEAPSFLNIYSGNTESMMVIYPSNLWNQGQTIVQVKASIEGHETLFAIPVKLLIDQENEKSKRRIKLAIK